MTDQSYKVCPHCQQPAILSAVTCLRCGHSFRTQFASPENRTQAIYAPAHQTQTVFSSPSLARPAARINIIASMWGLTAGAIAFSVFSPIISLLLDIPALVLAIILVCGKATADKVNGWIKIGLEIACMFFAAIFITAALVALSGEPETPRPAFDIVPLHREGFRTMTPTERRSLGPIPPIR